MFSMLKRARISLLTFRVMAGYFLLFFFSAIALFGFSTFLLDTYVNNMERDRIVEKVDSYIHIANSKGIAALAAQLRKQHTSNKVSNIYVQLMDTHGKPVWLTVPEQLNDLPSSSFSPPTSTTSDSWQFYDLPRENDLDVFSHNFPDGSVLYVGRTTERQEQLVESLQGIFLIILLGIVLFGAGGGAVFAYQVIRPLRRLTTTVTEVSSGDMSCRVPVHDPKGELDELAELINGMLQRIETLVVAMRDALNNVSHDLRTPLARMKAKIERALIEETSPEMQRETLMDCAEEIERINSTITMLMDIAEAETGQMRLNKETFSAKELLSEIEEYYDLIADDRKIAITVDAEDVLFFADRQRMAQAIGNLTDNALKYTPEGGAVTLQASASDNNIIFTVHDTGPGIPFEERERIFDKLYRLDKSRSAKGLGLGLSLVRAVMTAHGGKVWVTNAPEGGSVFTIELPVN